MQELTVGSNIDEESILEILREDVRGNIRSWQLNLAEQAARSIYMNFIPGLRPNCIKFCNTLVTVRDGIKTKDLNRDSAINLLRPAFNEFSMSVATMIEEIQNRESSSNVEIARKALTLQSKSKVEMMAAVEKNGFYFGTCPILALTKPPLDVSKLVRNGFKARNFEGYPIIQDQYTVGVSNDRVVEWMKKKEPRLFDPLGVMIAGSSKRYMELRKIYLDGLVAEARKRYPELDLVQLGNSCTWESSNWFWLLDNVRYKKLLSCTIASNPATGIIVRSWSFPFSS